MRKESGDVMFSHCSSASNTRTRGEDGGEDAQSGSINSSLSCWITLGGTGRARSAKQSFFRYEGSLEASWNAIVLKRFAGELEVSDWRLKKNEAPSRFAALSSRQTEWATEVLPVPAVARSHNVCEVSLDESFAHLMVFWIVSCCVPARHAFSGAQFASGAGLR